MFLRHGLPMFLIGLLVLTSTGGVLAQGEGPAGPAGPGFTYQGELSNGSGPVSATCDFQFSLYDALTQGTQQGATQTVPGVSVTNGRFAVTLNDTGQFGAGAFDGSARWLAVAVKCPADGGFTPLSPRQPLTPAPYALYAVNADLLDGQQAAAFQQHAQNVLVVAKSGGDFTTITAALNSVTTASASNAYLITVAPGVYSEPVTMKPYVDIEGAGELATKITWTRSSNQNTGTVIGASNAELRFLTVESAGGAGYTNAKAIYNTSAAPRLTHLTLTVSGGDHSVNQGVYNYSSSPTMTNVKIIAAGGPNNSSYGVYNEHSSSPTMTNVKITASGGMNSITMGVYNSSSSSPAMTNVSATASGPTSDNYGVYNSSSAPTMTNVSAAASGATSTNYGVYNSGSSSPTMLGSTISSSGGTNNYGVYNDASTVTIQGSTITVTAGGGNYGIWNNLSSATIQGSVVTASGGSPNDGLHNLAASGAYTITIDGSQITGSTSTIYSDSSHYTVQLGASQLIGSGVQGSGNYICAFTYTGGYAALNGTCH